MKLLIVNIFVFTLSISLFAQINQTDSKGRKQGGWQKNYPKSEVLQYKGQFRDDKPFGTFEYYYPSGQLKATIEHHTNGHHARVSYYFENKMLMTEGFYFDQKKDSTWVNYNEEGLVLSVESFKKNLLNGKKVIYYLEGQIETERLNPLSVGYYKNDTLHGEYREYFSTGKLKQIGTYQNGKVVGEWKEYYPNGAIFKISKFKDDRLHGWSVSFTMDGEENGKILYQNGEKLTGKELDNFLLQCKKNGIDPNQ